MWPWCFLVYCLFVRSLTLRASDLVGGLCPVAVSSVTLQLSFLYFFNIHQINSAQQGKRKAGKLYFKVATDFGCFSVGVHEPPWA